MTYWTVVTNSAEKFEVVYKGPHLIDALDAIHAQIENKPKLAFIVREDQDNEDDIILVYQGGLWHRVADSRY